jgi:hypothetical protein
MPLLTKHQIAAIPEEYKMHSAASRYTGIVALWLKVIIRAVFDWVSYRDSQRLEQKKLAERAHQWLFLPSEHMNSFVAICYMIDIDVDKCRQWAKSISKDQISKIEHLERESKFRNNELLMLAEIFSPDEKDEDY